LIARLAAGLTGVDNATKAGATQGEIAAGQRPPSLPRPRPVEPEPVRNSRAPNLIRVGVARHPRQAIPLQGSYDGAAADFLDLQVEVQVTAGERPLTADCAPVSRSINGGKRSLVPAMRQLVPAMHQELLIELNGAHAVSYTILAITTTIFP
jgi:hypothetical protein